VRPPHGFHKTIKDKHLQATPRRWTARHAYTLLELIVVLIVLGILAAIVVPRFANAVLVERLEAAGLRVECDIERLRLAARREGTAQEVVFDAGTATYTLSPASLLRSDLDATQVALNAPPYDVTIRSVDFDGDARLVFDGWGAPDSGGTLELCAGTQGLRLTLDGDTGRFEKTYLAVARTVSFEEIDPNTPSGPEGLW